MTNGGNFSLPLYGNTGFKIGKCFTVKSNLAVKGIYFSSVKHYVTKPTYKYCILRGNFLTLCKVVF